MPELPEVETVASYIRPKLISQKINKISVPVSYEKAIYPWKASKLNQIIANQKIVSVSRRAKFIVLQLENGILTIHLRMTGELKFSINSKELKYVTAIIELKNKRKLYFKDVRKFGKIAYLASLTELEKRLGPEPLSPKFNYNFLKNLLNSSSAMIKPFLLNQKNIAGLGNIYVDESLFLAKIHPQSKVNQIHNKKITALTKAIKKILKTSIKLNGTSFKTFYFGEKSQGTFKNHLKVFDRAGMKCKCCKGKIIKIKVAQRGTHLCDFCQKL